MRDSVGNATMKYTFVHNKKEYTLDMRESGNAYCGRINDVEYSITNVEHTPTCIVFTLNDIRYAVYTRKCGDHYYCSVAGENYTFEQKVGTGFRRTTAREQSEDSVSSPMPGLVVKIPVAVGDAVDEGTTLAIIEAMKMQNELRASRKGIVKKIHFQEGEQVDAFQPIVELE